MTIPNSILDQHSIILGKTGAGKSYSMRGLIETLLEQGKRVCIIDPKGDHWGIKSSADGKKPGFPVVIFGGDHADVPINPRVGKEVSELIATGNRPCVIDFRGWMPGDRTKFWIDFASTLFKMNRSPLWLAIDEVHNFAPQGKVLDPEAGKCLHWTNRIASEGRGLGIRLIMASQRPQKVHKDAVTCAETLIAMRVIHKLDRDAMKDWIDGAGDPERGKMVMNSLAEMKRGEAFVWYPEKKYFERVTFPKIKTFDSFKAPTGDEKNETPKGWAEVDLEEMKKKMARTFEEAKANDPTELRKQIQILRQENAKLLSGTGKKVDESAIAKAIKQAEAKIRQEVASQIRGLEATIQKQAATMRKAAELLTLGGAVSVPKFIPSKVALGNFDGTKMRTRNHIPVASQDQQGDLTNPEQRILDALAWFESIGITDPEQPGVAFLAGYRYGGGAFNNPRGALRTKGLVEYAGDRLKLTDLGRGLAHASDTALTNEELHQKVMNRLPSPEQKLLKPLLEAYPDSMSNDELAEASGYVVNTGGYNNPRGRLRTLGLIEYLGGKVRAKSLLFPLTI